MRSLTTAGEDPPWWCGKVCVRITQGFFTPTDSVQVPWMASKVDCRLWGGPLVLPLLRYWVTLLSLSVVVPSALLTFTYPGVDPAG